MARIQSLGRYQKVLLILMAVLALIFALIYPVTMSRVGFAYQDTILLPSQENGNTIYSGKLHGKSVAFTVQADKTVVFQYGDQTYGPYTAKEDATAIPRDNGLSKAMTGVELICGEEILFRGGVINYGEDLTLFHEDGTIANWSFFVVAGNSQIRDEEGNLIDRMAPAATTILHLMAGPPLTSKGQWSAYFLGVFICIVTAVSILFADELFRLRMSWRVQDPDGIKPSHIEIASRYIGWTASLILAVAVFVMGLQ